MWRFFLLVLLCFQQVFCSQIKEEEIDPLDFDEEFDPYIPISDFPIEQRKKRDTSDRPYGTEPVYHPIGPNDPFRPNRPTSMGKYFFKKIKQVAKLIDKKAKFFMKKFPTNGVFENENPFKGGKYPWAKMATPSDSYSVIENSNQIRPVKYNQPDITFTYSTNLIPKSMGVKSHTKPSSHISGGRQTYSSDEPTYSQSAPKYTSSSGSPSYTSSSSSYTSSSSSPSYTSSSSSPPYTSSSSLSYTPSSQPSSSTTYSSSKPSISSSIPSSPSYISSGSISGPSASTTYTSSDSSSLPTGSSSSVTSQQTYKPSETSNFVSVGPHSTITQESVSTVVEPSIHSQPISFETNSLTGSEIQFEQGPTEISDAEINPDVIANSLLFEKDNSPILLPNSQGLRSLWATIMAEEDNEHQAMEEMIFEAFSYHEQESIENDMIVQIVNDVDSLINLDMNDDATKDKVNSAIKFIKEDIDNLPESMHQELHSLKEVMTDYSNLLDNRHTISDYDFQQAKQVLAEDLDNIRSEHTNRRFFGNDDFENEDVLEFDEELDKMINDEVTNMMDKTGSLIDAGMHDDLSSDQIKADMEVLKESMNDLPAVVQEKQSEFSHVMDDFVNLLDTKEHLSPNIYQQASQVLADDLNHLRKNNNKKFFEDFTSNDQDEEIEFDDELTEMLNDELTEKIENVVKFMHFGMKDKSVKHRIRDQIDSIMDDIEMMPKPMKAEQAEFENVMHDITNLLDHGQQASPAEFELAMNVVKDDLMQIKKEHTNKRFFPSTNSPSQSSPPSSTHSQSPQFSSFSPSRPSYQEFESEELPPASVGPVHVIPINTAPKVKEFGQGKFFGRDERLGSKFVQHETLRQNERPQTESAQLYNQEELGSPTLPAQTGDGVLAYVVRDRNNPSRQFLVPASTLENGQFFA